ncbi:SGNH/GDSL hydrolase family protein [Alkalihalobacterium chitinilyticum]|uniref:SGNH/GDSL hydrolase family protein n=1 Tax=Alkalihalobacterium chitinilyticum TaxID=2980103 RepID=A0ABT5VF27_9BACI|nr:SGNH/GDSL hydrolase family protein [Alkalihalobacterium chitinilyticum]MDE5414024.1 SGNH/GDSL hydrolase family protein [Alkalihalobacterium chitinilyticum]
MKKLAIPFFCLVAVGIIIFGKVHYDNKLDSIGKSAKEQQLLDSSVSSTVDLEELVGLTANMSDALREKLFHKFEANENITLLVIGSDANFNSTPENSSWPFQLIDALTENYAGANFELETMNLEDMSTNHFIEINAHSKAAAIKPDVLILEPLLLNDNGIVKVDNTIENIEKLLATIKEEAPEAFFIIKPPNPIYRPTIYLEQVDRLKEFTLNSGYEYLDHWQAWPDVEDDDIKEFLTGVHPNERGHDLWAEYMINYFVSQ